MKLKLASPALFQIPAMGILLLFDNWLSYSHLMTGRQALVDSAVVSCLIAVASIKYIRSWPQGYEQQVGWNSLAVGMGFTLMFWVAVLYNNGHGTDLYGTALMRFADGPSCGCAMFAGAATVAVGTFRAILTYEKRKDQAVPAC